MKIQELQKQLAMDKEEAKKLQVVIFLCMNHDLGMLLMQLVRKKIRLDLPMFLFSTFIKKKLVNEIVEKSAEEFSFRFSCID